MVALVGIFLCASGAPGWADDIYRWTDSSGQVHFSNTPAAGDSAERIDATAESMSASAVQPAEAPTPAAIDGGDAEARRGIAAGTGDDLNAFSTRASLKRNDLERDLRTTEKRLRELDAQLKGLSGARARHAGGSAATGGVGTSLDVRSEEEKSLVDEREKLAQHATEVRTEAAKLRDEVVAKTGSKPAWWIEVK
jgi:hypothetical protein